MTKSDKNRDKDLAGQALSKISGGTLGKDLGGKAGSKTSHGTLASGGGSSRSSYGGSIYDQQYFTDDELASAAAVRAAAEAGQTTWEDAHAYVEGIRANYGYSGDMDGSKYVPLAKSDSSSGGNSGSGGGGFSYESAPTYTSKYQDQIDELTAEILGRAAFSYDHEADPTYQQYKKTYTAAGQRAMQDTLGQMSARTGGLASSYAGSAAQQTYNNYMGELANVIPELRQLAYEMYMDEGNTQRANLEMLMALEQGDYAKYLDLLAQYNTDRSFNYGVSRDEESDRRYDQEWAYQVGQDEKADKRYDQEWAYQIGRDEEADRRYDQEWAYQVGQDKVAASRYEDETAWERSQYASEKEYSQALQKAQTLAAAGDFSGYKALGYSDAEIANLKTAYDKAQAAARATGGSGSYGGSGGGGGTGGTDIVGTMLGFGSDAKAYEYLVNLGYTDAESERFWALYEAARDGGGDTGDSGEDDAVAAGVTNKTTSDGWIIVPGFKESISPTDLLYMVESKQVIEDYDPATGKYTYRKSGDYYRKDSDTYRKNG